MHGVATNNNLAAIEKKAGRRKNEHWTDKLSRKLNSVDMFANLRTFSLVES